MVKIGPTKRVCLIQGGLYDGPLPRPGRSLLIENDTVSMPWLDRSKMPDTVNIADLDLAGLTFRDETFLTTFRLRFDAAHTLLRHSPPKYHARRE